MAVVYRASPDGNLGVDDSKIAYKQFFGDGPRFNFSVKRLSNNPLKVTTVCLGLLCLLLLAAVIGQSVLHRNKNRGHEKTLRAMADDKETLQQNLRTALIAKKATETQRDDLKRLNDYTVKLKNQMQTNNVLLSEEAETLRAAKGQLESSNAALAKELKETKKLQEEVESNSNALNTAKQLLQKRYDATVKQRNDLQQNYNSVVREKDILQNKFNNVTRSREQLQLKYNDFTARLEALQDSYNVSSSEKERLERHHQNLTAHQQLLETSCALLKKAEDELRASYQALLRDKQEVESRLSGVTAERDTLRARGDNLTVQVEALQDQLHKLNATIEATQKQCPSGWQKFQNSCYYKSLSKKTWESGRQFCQNKQTDLVTINSREEMEFVNKLYSGSTEVWIGLSDSGAEGEWKWVDGSDLSLSFWGKDQPNSHNGRNQDCVEVWHQSSGIGEWNDESCTIQQYFICEM